MLFIILLMLNIFATTTVVASDSLNINSAPTSANTEALPSADTELLQGQILVKINQALSRGLVSPEQATDFTSQLNKINEQEVWYKSRGLSAPQDTLNADIEFLKALSADIDKQLPQKAFRFNSSQSNNPTATYIELHKMIANALTQGKISYSEAEEYYFELEQIESNIENLNNNPLGSSFDRLTLNNALQQLKNNLKKSLKR
jgi:hypothetical protein